MEELRQAIGLVNQARQAHLEACAIAWAALKRADQSLADEILSRWSGEDVAAQWLCRAKGDDPSPADLVLAGRSDSVRDMILRAKHGFSG
ncbi:hypothetical protein [Thermomonas fusca]|uniref:DUF2384 domain-containing protein n=1 Tax=Thermomonas fusca TaxID=215690 RepID=A0A5R9PBM9_9GAMM|nr:hypothetical protein [Thermomonas fusca]TLX20954.1 hypothetical protein E5S66_12170 [Thermomonas fusca]